MSESAIVEKRRVDFVIFITYCLSIIGLLLSFLFILLFFSSNGIHHLLSSNEPIPDDLPDFEGFFAVLGFFGVLICLPPSVFGLLFNFGMQKRSKYALYGISAIYLYGILVLLYLFYQIISFVWSLNASELTLSMILVRLGFLGSFFVILFCWAIYVEYILLFDPQTKKLFSSSS